MSNYVLDRSFEVEESGGVARHRVVVIGEGPGGCRYPGGPNAAGVLGVTTHGQSRQHKTVGVRMLGLVPCEASAPISAGQPVAVADATGKIKEATGATMTLGSVGTNSAVLFQFRTPGMVGDGFQIHLTQGANGSPLSHLINGVHVYVTLATDGGGTVTTTAADLIAYIAAAEDLSRFLQAFHVDGSNGTGLMEVDDEGAFGGGHEGLNVLGIALQAASADGDVIDVFLTL